MAAPIQRLSRLASKTFSRLSHADGFQIDRLAQLKTSMNDITAADVNFDFEAIKARDDKLAQTKEKAPVSYIHLWEDDCFSMGIFIVKNGGRLPLHDHPGMVGFLKVIHGTLRVVSLSEVEGVAIPEQFHQQLSKRNGKVPLVKSVRLESDKTVTASQECCQLTPSIGNFHEITSVSEMAAFVDILAPPYALEDKPVTGSRDCHYYKELSASSVPDCKDVKWIIGIGQPTDFWCDSIEYAGPELDTCLHNT